MVKTTSKSKEYSAFSQFKLQTTLAWRKKDLGILYQCIIFVRKPIINTTFRMSFIGMKFKATIFCCLLAILSTATAQIKSPKRGIGWDEKTQKLSNAPIDKLLPGVSWIYTWGETPLGTADNLGDDDGIMFIPMAWGRNFNETAIRDYIKSHSSVKYLLGFNEPNFAAQANMSPKEAASLWHVLEDIASEFDLRLVAPALNFSGEKVDGQVWGIYDWLDEFIRSYKEANDRLPKIDCLALHCYMNWYGANTWFVNEYFYSDIFKDGNDRKYPNIVELLNTVKEATGHYPRMMLTEFCSWEGDKDGFVTNVDNQIDQMTQRIQKMEQSDMVEGYAWFMANANASEYPYMSVFETNNANSDLSTLGKVFVNMSGFDLSKYYTPGEIVDAKDYVDATTDEQIVRLRPNTEPGSDHPLQIQLTAANPGKGEYSAATYRIDVPSSGIYTFTLHAKGDAAMLRIEAPGNDNSAELTIAGQSDVWADYTANITLPAGKNDIKITNLSTNPVLLNSWKFDAGTWIATTTTPGGSYTVYNLQGVKLATFPCESSINLEKGIYILVSPDGSSRKIAL